MQLELPGIVPSLRNAQNQDGGWGYRGGASWTEPTACVLLALAAAGERGENYQRGLAWLEKGQRGDGGWAPNRSVDRSTWVTAMAVLVLADRTGAAALPGAYRWLLRQSGRESSYFQRFRDWLLGFNQEQNVSYSGWPWYPGSSSWVTPTAFTILALEKGGRPDPRRRERIEIGREFLLSRMCSDGGWNHGVTRALGYSIDSYPETTGQALLALAGFPEQRLEKSLRCAEGHLRTCRSAEGRSWLEMALLAHGRSPSGFPKDDLTLHSAMDRALIVLAEAATRGKNVFLS
ncbi:MAG: prenyltransferase/squalene oxidase repeat-containing protein [Bryobacteraceae bacterium]